MINNNPAKVANYAYVERDLISKIKPYFKKKEILSITGPRRVGKTTVLELIFKHLSKTKKCLFLTFEKRADLEIFEKDIENFKKIFVLPYEVVIIDEIQYAKEAGQKLKYLYDTTNTKFFISGSSSLEIRDLGKYLVGRIYNFLLYPFSFNEFLKSKNNNIRKILEQNSLSISQFIESGLEFKPQIKSNEIKKLILSEFNEYLIYGGYPSVVNSKTIEEKKIDLENIMSNYLIREIKDLLRLASDDSLLKLAQIASLQIGNMISYNELGQTANLSFREVKRHLKILKETFILDLVLPFYSNKRVELVKNPKVYFLDTGFRNSIIDNFANTNQRTDIGQLAENYIFNTIKAGFLRKRVNFWRTKSQAEVDFVIESNGQVLPIEVKFTSLGKGVVGKSLYSFVNKYSPKNAIITTTDNFLFKRIKKTDVYFIPIYLLKP